jgi:hypothetical protein
MDPKLAALEKRVAELEAFAREQLAESIALGVALQALTATVADRDALRQAVAQQLVGLESAAPADAAPLPDAIRMLVLPRLRTLLDAL